MNTLPTSHEATADDEGPSASDGYIHADDGPTFRPARSWKIRPSSRVSARVRNRAPDDSQTPSQA